MERSTFERLVREHHAAVFRAARRIARSDEDAADVAQEVFLDVLRGGPRFAAAREPGAVLRWMAVKKALAQARAARGREERERGMERGDAQADEGLERMERAELRALVQRLVEQLPDELRAALALRFGEGLSFAGVARAGECSESTAHARVQQGLEKLRERLARLGHATPVGALGALLAAPENAPAVPAGLEAKLLALSAAAPAASVAGLAPFVAGLALLVVGAVVALRPWSGPPAGAETVAEARAAAPAPAERSAPSSNPAENVPTRVALADLMQGEPIVLEEPGAPRAGAAAGERGLLTGRVVDASGRPIAGARVVASSLARQGKLALYERDVETDEQGRFALELPVGHIEGQRYTALVRHPDFVPHRSKVFALAPGETRALGELALLALSEDHPGDWSLTAHVVDEAGAPVAGAIVAVQRRVRVAGGGWGFDREDSGRTDAAGRVELAGAHLGDKRVLVSASASGLREGRFEHPIDRVGAGARTFELERGLAIRGRVRAVGDSAPPAGLQVHATLADGGSWLFAELASDGRFELRGLEEREYTLGVRAAGCSPAERRVLAGTEGLELALKRRDDPRDVGDHMAELHGRAVDAATGAPLALDFWDVDTIWIPEEERSLSPLELHARYRAGSMAQREAQLLPPPPSPGFHVVGISPGAWLLVASPRGYAPAFAGPFELAEGELVAGIELRFGRGATLEGLLFDSGGDPLPGGQVWLGAPGARAAERLAALDAMLLDTEWRQLPGCARTDERGRFRFEHVPAGLPLQLGALHRDAAPTLGPALELREGEVRGSVELEVTGR